MIIGDDDYMQLTEMNGKMIGRKPLFIALAQRKEERRAHLQVLSPDFSLITLITCEIDSKTFFMYADSVYSDQITWDNVANGINNAWVPSSPTRRANVGTTPYNVHRPERTRSGAVTAYGVWISTSVHAWDASRWPSQLHDALPFSEAKPAWSACWIQAWCYQHAAALPTATSKVSIMSYYLYFLKCIILNTII